MPRLLRSGARLDGGRAASRSAAWCRSSKRGRGLVSESPMRSTCATECISNADVVTMQHSRRNGCEVRGRTRPPCRRLARGRSFEPIKCCTVTVKGYSTASRGTTWHERPRSLGQQTSGFPYIAHTYAPIPTPIGPEYPHPSSSIQGCKQALRISHTTYE